MDSESRRAIVFRIWVSGTSREVLAEPEREPSTACRGAAAGARRDGRLDVAFDDASAGTAALNRLEVEAALGRHAARER